MKRISSGCTIVPLSSLTTVFLALVVSLIAGPASSVAQSRVPPLDARCEAPGPHETFRSGTVTVEGGELYYETQGRGPDVVLIHGGYVDRRLWDPQFAALAEHFRVTRYDIRGYGRSMSDGKTSIPHVDDLRAVLDAARVTRGSVVGLSLGAMIATDFAISHPERVDNLVLVSPGLRGVEPPNAREQEEFFARLRACDTKACGIDLIVGHRLLASGMKQPCFAANTRLMLGENWNALGLFKLHQWPDRAVIDNLHRIRARSLVIVGSADDAVIHHWGWILSSRIPGAHEITVPDVSHHLNMEVPDKFNAIIEQFLRTTK